MSAEQASDPFAQAKDLSRKANDLAASDEKAAKDLYQKAAMRFERIAREGPVRNGKLYYNIGNAYFRMGDIGRAILCYRRAAPLIPDDEKLRQNLSFARSKCVDKIEEKQEAKVLRTLFFWYYDLSAKLRTELLVVALAVLWTVASIRIFRRHASLSWAVVVSAVVAGLLFGSLLVEAVTAARTTSGVILAAEVVARKGDGESYEPSFKTPLHPGTEFDVIEDRGDGHYVELHDGRPCWVPTRAVGLVQRQVRPPGPGVR